MYISSYDYNDFEKSRKILVFNKIFIDTRNVLVTEVSEPLNGQNYGLEGEISTLYLINRVDEHAFDKLSKFPIDVHVLIVKDIKTKFPSSLSELQSIAWATLYDNEYDSKWNKFNY